MSNQHVISIISVANNADKRFLPFLEVSHHGITFYKSYPQQH